MWQELEPCEKGLLGVRTYWTRWKNVATSRDIAQGRKRREKYPAFSLLPPPQYPSYQSPAG